MIVEVCLLYICPPWVATFKQAIIFGLIQAKSSFLLIFAVWEYAALSVMYSPYLMQLGVKTCH